MAGTKKWEEIRRSTPEQVEDHKRWAAFAVSGATLGDLRRLCGKTQEEVGKAMGISGVEAGRMEHRSDVQVSTLVRYLAALGGELELFARFGEHGEKLMALRLGDFDHKAFMDLVVKMMEAGEATEKTKLKDFCEAFRSAYPLQPTPDPSQLGTCLAGVKTRFRESGKMKLAARVDFYRAQRYP